MATCLCDAFFDDVARATVEVLEHVGCTIEFPEGQTCCGQPAFNGGDWPASRQVVRHTMKVFGADLPVVVPSASCAAMVRHGAPLEFRDQPDAAQLEHLAHRTWELADYLVNGLGVQTWPGKLEARIAFHRSCHSRGTGSGAAVKQLLGSIPGVTLVAFGEEEQCCGFGGTFSVGFPHISAGMGTLKLEHLEAAAPDYVVSGDMSCLMHIGGLAEKRGHSIRARHVAQILRDARVGARKTPSV